MTYVKIVKQTDICVSMDYMYHYGCVKVDTLLHGSDRLRKGIVIMMNKHGGIFMDIPVFVDFSANINYLGMHLRL